MLLNYTDGKPFYSVLLLYQFNMFTNILVFEFINRIFFRIAQKLDSVTESTQKFFRFFIKLKYSKTRE